jgi:NAD(P) transhydrogenase subunit beta
MSNLSTVAYLISSVLFILSLRGLSHPTSARKGNFLGILGMAIAIGTTIANPGVLSYKEIGIAFVIGGLIGSIIAVRIQMTALPQLVAAFHSLVGLAAVFVAASAYYNPAAFGIGNVGSIPMGSLIEMSIGTAIGAVTFTGSIIAFGKLQGFVSGNPLVFKGQHFLNLLLGLTIIGLIVKFCIDQNPEIFWLIVLTSFLIGVLLIVPIGGADMPVIVSMLNSYSGWVLMKG